MRIATWYLQALFCGLCAIGNACYGVQSVQSETPEVTRTEAVRGANEPLGRFFAAYEHLSDTSIEVTTRDLGSIHRVSGITEDVLKSAATAGQAVEVDGTLMLIVRKQQIKTSKTGAAARWILPASKQVNQVLPRIDQIWKGDSAWLFYSGLPDEAVRQPDLKMEFDELTKWLQQPSSSTFELIRASEHFYFMVQYLYRVLPLDPKLQTEKDSSGLDVLISDSLGIRATINANGELQKVLYKSSSDRYTEVTYRGSIKPQGLPYPYPQYEVIRGWKVGDVEPSDTVENRSYKENTEVRVALGVQDTVFDWGTYVRFEYTENQQVVRNRDGAVVQERTDARKQLKAPRTADTKPAKQR